MRKGIYIIGFRGMDPPHQVTSVVVYSKPIAAVVSCCWMLTVCVQYTVCFCRSCLAYLLRHRDRISSDTRW